MSRLFITQPIATSLLAIALCLGGLLGYRALPVAALPQVDFPDFSRIGCPSLPKYNFLELGKTLTFRRLFRGGGAHHVPRNICDWSLHRRLYWFLNVRDVFLNRADSAENASDWA